MYLLNMTEGVDTHRQNMNQGTTDEREYESDVQINMIKGEDKCGLRENLAFMRST